MRIGIDTTALPPRPAGAGIYIVHLTRQLAARAGEFELVVFCHQRAVPLLALPDSPHVRPVVISDQSRARRLAWEQTSLPGLARRHRLDLLHSPHYTMPLRLPCRSVVTFHDMIFFIYPQLHTLAKRYFFRWFIRVSGQRADALIADSDSTRRDAMRLAGVAPGKIHTVHLGVTGEFRPITDPQVLVPIKARYGLPDKFLLYVGVIEPRKNLPSLLRAFAKLAGEGEPHHLVVAGGKGWMYDQVFQLVAESGLQDRIHFIGHVGHDDLPGIFNLAEAFIYPSLYEGFGIPVLEALACGTPVVTSNISSIPEITGDCALLVSPSDQEALTDAMRRILADQPLREDLARRGLMRAAGFTWGHTARRTLAVYEQVLGQSLS